MRRFAYVRITDDYVLNYFIFKRLTIYVMFDFAGKVYDPKMHQVQRQKEPGREKSPPIVFSEKICIWWKILCLVNRFVLGKLISILWNILSLGEHFVSCEIFLPWWNTLSIRLNYFLCEDVFDAPDLYILSLSHSFYDVVFKVVFAAPDLNIL